jgi:S-adenosyl-L-methionine hydrolase (adenosine-forming)
MLPIAFLTDYGYCDEFAGVCRLVIERLAPGAAVIDLTHGVPPGDVRRGALALEQAARVAPPAVYLAVVDPGVGTARRAVAVATGEGSFLVGPDNGLLALAIEASGGAREAVDVSASALRLEPTSATFHGRDILAPVAAHLAAGRPLLAVGEPVDPAGLQGIELPGPVIEADAARVHVLYADRFGNLVLGARVEDLEPLAVSVPGSSVSLDTGDRTFAAVTGATFADASAGEDADALVVYPDSSGRLAVAVYLGSAAELLGIAADDELVIRGVP